MGNLNKILFLGLILIIFDGANGSISEEHFRSALKMMKDVCLPKFKSVKDEVASQIKNGVFPEDRDVKCYVNCIMELMGLMKKGKLQFKATMKQVELLVPPHMKENYRKGVEACKGAVVGVKEPCEASYEQLKCYEKNIVPFYFP